MGESTEYKWALKVVIKRQMRDLLEQLHESGEEVAIMSVNTEDSTWSQFGSSEGEWFLLEQRNLTSNFLKHCQRYKHRNASRKSIFSGTSESDLTSTLRSPTRQVKRKDKNLPSTGKKSANTGISPPEPTTTLGTRSSTRQGRGVSAKYIEGIASLMRRPRNQPLDGTDAGDTADSQATDASVNKIKQEGDTPNDTFDVEAYANMYNDEINDTDSDYSPSDNTVNDPEVLLTEEIHTQPVAAAAAPLGLTAAKRKSLEIRIHRKRKKTRVSDTVKLQCSHCPMLIQGRKGLKAHIDRVHLKVRKSKCQVCPKTFWSNCDVQEHMVAVHTRKCDACNQYVVETTPWTESVTMKTVRNVLCVCGATVSIFTQIGAPKKYLDDDEPDENGEVRKRRAYRSDAKFACGVCHKLFSSQKNCEQHQKAHSHVKSSVCHICGAGFSYGASLKKHVNRIHRAMENVCSLCGTAFCSTNALTLHTVKFHSIPATDEGTSASVEVANNVTSDTET